MQWVRQDYHATLGPLNPMEAFEVLADPTDKLSFPARLVRTFWTVNLRWDLAQTGGRGRWFCLGVVRTDPTVPAMSVTPLAANDADRQWVFRQDYKLPFIASNEAGNGYISLQGELYHLDWQYRGGKGTLVNKDVELRLVLETDLPTGTLEVAILALHLIET